MGRQSEGAWYRSGKDVWCATVNGKSVSLGIKGRQNRKAAQDAWHRLMANVPAISTLSAGPTPAVSRPDATTAALVDGFLADSKVRVKPNTLATYTGLLTSVKEHFGDTPAGSLTPTAVIRFTQRAEWGASHRHNHSDDPPAKRRGPVPLRTGPDSGVIAGITRRDLP